MATTKLEIRKLVTRLVQLPAQDSTMFGVSAEDVRESIGKAIERYAASDDHATRMVDWLLFDRSPEQRRWRPTPGEIRDAAEAVPAKLAPEGICVHCGGSGGHTRGLVTWQETRPDGTLRKCQEVVADEEAAHKRAGEMPPEARAMSMSCSVDCVCRKKLAPA